MAYFTLAKGQKNVPRYSVMNNLSSIENFQSLVRSTNVTFIQPQHFLEAKNITEANSKRAGAMSPAGYCKVYIAISLTHRRIHMHKNMISDKAWKITHQTATQPTTNPGETLCNIQLIWAVRIVFPQSSSTLATAMTNLGQSSSSVTSPMWNSAGGTTTIYAALKYYNTTCRVSRRWPWQPVSSPKKYGNWGCAKKTKRTNVTNACGVTSAWVGNILCKTHCSIVQIQTLISRS